MENCWFSVNLVGTGAVTSQSIVRQVRKHDVQSDEIIAITGGYNSVHFSARLGALPQS